MFGRSRKSEGTGDGESSGAAHKRDATSHARGSDDRSPRDQAPADRSSADRIAPRRSSAEGPWDLAAAPSDDLTRVDLGSLRVPAMPGVEIRVEAGPDGQIVAAALSAGSSALELGVFAAPRSAGIWDEVRAEIADSLREQGSGVTEQDGAFGAELVATLGGPQGDQTARFVGVDGPRWFVRGLFTGPAATNPVQAGLLTRSLREVVVVRGDEAMPVRDPLPLTVPQEALDDALDEAGRHSVSEESDAADESGDQRRTLPPPERGPEITETR